MKKNENHLGQLPVHQLIKQMKLYVCLWVYDAVSFCARTMWDENSIYPKIETFAAYARKMNDELVEKVQYWFIQTK